MELVHVQLATVILGEVDTFPTMLLTTGANRCFAYRNSGKKSTSACDFQIIS